MSEKLKEIEEQYKRELFWRSIRDGVQCVDDFQEFIEGFKLIVSNAILETNDEGCVTRQMLLLSAFEILSKCIADARQTMMEQIVRQGLKNHDD